MTTGGDLSAAARVGEMAHGEFGAPSLGRRHNIGSTIDLGADASVVDASVWWLSTAEALSLPDALGCLSGDEERAMRRLRRAADRERFLAARVALRHALSRAVDDAIPPAQWRYRDGPSGKPTMGPGLPRLEFNLSHAGACVAVGVSRSGPIGVDVEGLVPDGRREIVDDVLTERERACLSQCPHEERWATFLAIWTVKEACAKALGLGVGLDFRHLEVTLDPVRVLMRDGPAGPARAFNVATRRVAVAGRPYCLGIATTG